MKSNPSERTRPVPRAFQSHGERERRVHLLTSRDSDLSVPQYRSISGPTFFFAFLSISGVDPYVVSPHIKIAW